jgi:hypothetical protein
VGVTIRGEALQKTIASLKGGEVFILPQGNGHLVGVIGGMPDERILVILGSQGTMWDSQGAGWMEKGGRQMAEELVYVIPNARLEFARGPLGYPQTGTETRNGTVVVDEDGVAWLATHRGTRRLKFRLSDGIAGNPKGRSDRYNSWRLVWQPVDADEIIELLASKP